MIIPCCVIFIISLFYKETISEIFANNLLPSSDILTDAFFNEIRTNDDLPLFELRIQSDVLCRLNLKRIARRVMDPSMMPFFESWGHIPSGVKVGHTYEVGNFDLCIHQNEDLNNSAKGMPKIESQFCFMEVPYRLSYKKHIRIPQWNTPTKSMEKKDRINIGICVPESCSPETIRLVFEILSYKTRNKFLRNVTISRCTTGKPDPPQGIIFMGIIIFSIFGLLLILSTCYDLFMNFYEVVPLEPLLAFSLLTNGKKIFAIDVDPSPETITCIPGIRVLSMMWIIYCNTFLTSLLFPAINRAFLLEWYTDFWSMHILNGTVSFDTFIFLGGLIDSWAGLRKLDETNGKINPCMMYLHRYIRITPAVSAMVLFKASINHILYSGPFKYISTSKNKCDTSNWWPILLYINNYFRTSACFDQTWILAVNFQLFVLSPLLLFPMWKCRKNIIIVPVLVLICLFSVGFVIRFYIINHFTCFITATYPQEWRNTYIPTHTRCPPWIIGFGLGYYMHINRGKTFELSKKCQTIGWIVSFSILLGIIYGPFIISTDNHGTVIEAALYEGLKRLFWAIALAWIVFACHNGFGKTVNTFLGHPIWQPLSRLTFSLYLVHVTVARLNYGIMRKEMHYSGYGLLLVFWAVYGISLVVAVCLSLTFEYPVKVLEQCLSCKAHRSKITVDNETKDDGQQNPQSEKKIPQANYHVL